MEQIPFNDISHSTKIDQLTKAELAQKYQVVIEELARVIKENYQLRNQKISDEQLNFILQEQLADLQNSLYGTSSERYKKPEDKKKEKPEPKPRIKQPSERYPNIPVREELVPFDEVPHCDSCGKVMTDSGLTEESEQLTVIPKKFEIPEKFRQILAPRHGKIKIITAWRYPGKSPERDPVPQEVLREIRKIL